MHHIVDIPLIGKIACDSTRLFDAARQTSALISELGHDAFTRHPSPGHVTGSAFILSPDRTQTLLLHHRKLDLWVPPGGHCDGDYDVRRVAKREAEEELGVTGLELASREIFDVNVHDIPARADVPAHLHYDVRFLIELDPAVPIPGNEESLAQHWVKLSDLEKWADRASVLIVRKAAQASQPA